MILYLEGKTKIPDLAIDFIEVYAQKGSVIAVSDVGCGAAICRAALESAALVATTPICSPFSSMTLTSLALISSLMESHAGQPSNIAPRPMPWDSPKVVTFNIVPKDEPAM